MRMPNKKGWWLCCLLIAAPMAHAAEPVGGGGPPPGTLPVPMTPIQGVGDNYLVVMDRSYHIDSATKIEDRAGYTLGRNALKVGTKVRVYQRAGVPGSYAARVVVQ